MAPSPLRYTPGDRVGIALDLDGTAYRDGSVFVETMAYLSVGDSTLDLETVDRERLRRAVLAVARYRGGAATRRRWAWTLRMLDAAGTVGGSGVAGDALERLSDLRARRPRRGESAGGPDADYAGMRRATLDGYGSVLRGRDRATVVRATDRLVRDRLPTDGRLRAALGRVAAAGGETAFVSDAPAHLVRSHASTLVDDAPVRATSFRTDTGRYTGAYDPVDKRAALEGLRESRGWDYVVAAGDSAVDAGMADVADCFLAVDGQGDGRRAFDALDPTPLSGPASLRRSLGPDRRAVRVGPDDELGSALVTLLRAVGVF